MMSMKMLPNVIIRHLQHSFSDHCPFLLQTECMVNRSSVQIFWFKAWWILDDSLKKL